MRLPSHLPLFWTICLINGAVFVVGATVLLLSPASVSADPVPSEAVVIGVGLLVMLLTDALLIRWALAPLQRLISRLEGINRLQPTQLPAELVPELAAVRESARAGLADVRRVARRLRPGVLEDLGLTSALAALATDFADHSSASVRRVFAPGLPALSPEAEVVVYRVAQEALTNAARHADASEVELSLQRLGGDLVLEVRDDGRGFAGLSDGSGLMGMRERAALVRAELSVVSQPRRGTTVRLSVPAPSDSEVPS